MLATYLWVKPPKPPSELFGVLRPEFRQLLPFQLQTHDQGPFNQKSLQGKWSLVFFGYLSCPDACPNTLYELNLFYGLLQDEIGKVPDDTQVLFVSVDPARDSGKNLAEYARFFNPNFIGATAGQGAIDRFAEQFGARYLLEPETTPGQYLISHTSAIFLVDPLGRLVATFSHPHYASTLLSQYQKIVRYFSENS
jgi:protein SCO1/2